MIFQSYALWPHMTVTENVAYGLHAAQARPRRRSRAGRRRSWPRPARGAGGALSRRALRRAAAARRAGARADRRAGGCCSTSRSPTSTPICARRCASRSAGCTTNTAHHRLRDARPGGGDDHGRPDRGDECRQDRAGSARPRRSTIGRARNSSLASSARATSEGQALDASHIVGRGRDIAAAPATRLSRRRGKPRSRSASTRSSCRRRRRFQGRLLYAPFTRGRGACQEIILQLRFLGV